MTEPLVSVLIPVYNAGKFLRPSVESILSQTYKNLEIIIINDGSTDGCMDSISNLKDSRMRILSQPNSGTSIALNRGLEELTGEFYAVQGADDISYRNRIKRQVQCMLENPHLAAVFTGCSVILDGRQLAPRFASKDVQECREDIQEMRIPSADATAMYRVSLVKNIRYEPSLRIGQGCDYILRVGEQYNMMVLGACLYSYRCLLGSNTRQDWRRRQQYDRQVLERACRRRGIEISGHFLSHMSVTAKNLHREQEHGIVSDFMESVLDLRRVGRFREATSTAFSCLRLHPCDPYYYKPLAYLMAPMTLIRCYRSRKKGK